MGNAEDEKQMRQALAEAKKGLGRTSPNPAVGCLIVKEGKVLARGFHKQAGLPHAEIEALSRLSGEQTRGATLYVNLEPCCHQGRTGPCTEAIIAAGISRVVVGMTDPNPLVNGRGIARLREGGVEVTEGVLAEECKRLNAPFARWITAGRPHVTLKAAVTLDGKIAESTGRERQWVTGEEAREEVHRMRDAVDAVLVGANTVLRDDPLLTTRLPKGGRTARRVVLDARLRTPSSARVLVPVKGAAPTTLFAGHEVGKAKEEELRTAGAEIVRVPPGDRGGVDLAATLSTLAKDGVMSVLVEGGAEVFTSFLQARAVDRIVVFVAPKILGGQAKPMVGPLGGPGFSLADVGVKRFGDDVMFEGVPDWGS